MNYIRPMEGWIWPVEYSLPTPGKEYEPEATMLEFYPASVTWQLCDIGQVI